jgi:hypothetical protein
MVLHLQISQKPISIERPNGIFGFSDHLFIVLVHHTLIRNFSTSAAIEIPREIEFLGPSCAVTVHRSGLSRLHLIQNWNGFT